MSNLSTDLAPETTGPRELRAQRFADLIRYAQKVLGRGSGEKASQRELADHIRVAGTMVTRYLSGSVDWYNCRTHTAALIAAAAELHVGTVYVWIEEGREMAFRHEALIRSRPAAFRPLDLARELVVMLQQESTDDEPVLDYSVVKQKLAAVEAESPRLYGSFVHRIGAEGALAKIEFGQPLSDEEWQKINELLGEPLDQELCNQKTDPRMRLQPS